MKTFLECIVIALVICLIASPYFSLNNLSYLSKLHDITDAIKDCTKEIHELVKSVDKLREEVKGENDTGNEKG